MSALLADKVVLSNDRVGDGVPRDPELETSTSVILHGTLLSLQMLKNVILGLRICFTNEAMAMVTRPRKGRAPNESSSRFCHCSQCIRGNAERRLYVGMDRSV